MDSHNQGKERNFASRENPVTITIDGVTDVYYLAWKASLPHDAVVDLPAHLDAENNQGGLKAEFENR